MSVTDDAKVTCKSKDKLAPDVYENSKKLNFQLATKGPLLLYSLKQIAGNSAIPAAGGMVVGAFGFFGNRYYRSKGDDSADAYMGQIVGAVQFGLGFGLFAAEAIAVYYASDNPAPFLRVLQMSKTALAITEFAVITMNSYLYGNGQTEPKETLKQQ